MRLTKYDAFTAKEKLGYRGRKSCVSVVRGAAKREEKQRGTEEETNLQINYSSSPIKNRENEEKDSDTHSQETEEATGREKVGEGATTKRRTQEEIATKPKIAGRIKDTKEKVEQRNRQRTEI